MILLLKDSNLMEEFNPAVRIKQRSFLKRTRQPSPKHYHSTTSMRSTMLPGADIDRLLKQIAN